MRLFLILLERTLRTDPKAIIAILAAEDIEMCGARRTRPLLCINKGGTWNYTA